jgi:hypothetical protein
MFYKMVIASLLHFINYQVDFRQFPKRILNIFFLEIAIFGVALK